MINIQATFRHHKKLWISGDFCPLQYIIFNKKSTSFENPQHAIKCHRCFHHTSVGFYKILFTCIICSKNFTSNLIVLNVALRKCNGWRMIFHVKLSNLPFFYCHYVLQCSWWKNAYCNTLSDLYFFIPISKCCFNVPWMERFPFFFLQKNNVLWWLKPAECHRCLRLVRSENRIEACTIILCNVYLLLLTALFRKIFFAKPPS